MLRKEAIYELEDAKDGYAEYLSIDAINIAIEALKQPEIITCGKCVNFSERDFCKVAGHNVHRKSNCMKVFGVERRTDEMQ